MLKILGKTYHCVHDLSWQSERGPRSNQLCILDPDFMRDESKSLALDFQLTEQVFTFLHRNNPLYASYRALATLPSADAHLIFKKTSRRTHGPVLGDAPGRTGSSAVSDEVAGILSIESDAPPGEIVIWKIGAGRSTRIPSISPIYDALSFPLLRPYAEASWEPGMLSTTGHKMTHLEYHRQIFLTHPRMWETGRLAQEMVVDAFSRIESERLTFLRHNQGALRVGTHQDISERLCEDGDGPLPGHRIVLPATHVGSPRYMRNAYQDAMAIVGRCSSPISAF
jgi:hypothetical protein